jgi:hypothetical protein
MALGELRGPMREETNSWLNRVSLGVPTQHATAAEGHNRLMLTKAIELAEEGGASSEATAEARAKVEAIEAERARMNDSLDRVRAATEKTLVPPASHGSTSSAATSSAATSSAATTSAATTSAYE